MESISEQMNMNISHREQILGGLWGSLVGDALGVPVEFKEREELRADPVKGMRGFGSHKQPPGTWSDDSSLLLCSADSLVCHEFDTADMGKRFVRWYQEEIWTPHGKVFDVGVSTSRALTRIARGRWAEVIHTLTASLWCLLTTSSFKECVLKAVNLGGDTDTTGCVAGGLAGVHYGLSAISQEWFDALARRDEVASLFNRFAELIPVKA